MGLDSMASFDQHSKIVGSDVSTYDERTSVSSISWTLQRLNGSKLSNINTLSSSGWISGNTERTLVSSKLTLTTENKS